MDKHQFRIIVFTSLFLAVAVLLFASRPKTQSPVYTPGPIPITKAQVPQLTTAGAPDGKYSLTMKQEMGKDSVTYTFLMKDESTGVSTQIFSDSVQSGTDLSIPPNTFSSDDKYIFLKKVSSSQTGYFVLTSSGNSITKDQETLDFSSLFTVKYPNYIITDVTGWAGPTLIIINTNNSDGSLGPSFWFDVASQSFIRLGTRFN